jgi:hypothetical protein
LGGCRPSSTKDTVTALGTESLAFVVTDTHRREHVAARFHLFDEQSQVISGNPSGPDPYLIVAPLDNPRLHSSPLPPDTG